MNASISLDTSRAPPKDRFSLWREALLSSFFHVRCESECGSNFAGTIETTRHKTISLSRMSGIAYAMERRETDIRMDKDEVFLLAIQTSATAEIRQFGASALLRPGDMALCDSTKPFRLRLNDGFSQTVVQFPKAKLLRRLPNAQMAAARRIDGQAGIGNLIRECILSLSIFAGDSNQSLCAMIEETLVDLIATAAAATIGDLAALPSFKHDTLLRAKTWIRDHLERTDLDRNAVALAIGMSVRRLNALFSEEGSSISDFIRQTRLETVCLELRDERFSQISISEIALRNGFANFQHFSTSFKAHYGKTPREWRVISLG